MKYLNPGALVGLFLTFILAAPLPGVRFAHAAGDACGIKPSDIEAVRAIQNNASLSYSDELVQELSLRKRLVSAVINCAKADAQSLQGSLNAVAAADDMKPAQTQLSGRFDDANNFYDIELGKLSNAGIAGTESVAKEVLAWRQGTYLPLAGVTNNFILWTQNQVLFRTAQSRMNQTGRAVAFIESAAGNDDLQKAFNDAQASFSAAQQANVAAQGMIVQPGPPDQAGALIKQSLQSLSDTYQKLFDVSTMIGKLLPQ